MRMTVHGGKMLLIIGDRAIAHVTDTDRHDTQATLIGTTGSLLHIDAKPLGAAFINGALEADDKWLVEALRFLGYVVYKKPCKRCSKKCERPHEQSR